MVIVCNYVYYRGILGYKIYIICRLFFFWPHVDHRQGSQMCRLKTIDERCDLFDLCIGRILCFSATCFLFFHSCGHFFGLSVFDKFSLLDLANILARFLRRFQFLPFQSLSVLNLSVFLSLSFWGW